MKKRKESILLGLALLVICAGPAVSSSIVVSDTSGNPGDTAVLVEVSLANDIPYAGSEVSLRYNSTVLDLNRIETGPRLLGQSGTGYYEFSSGQAAFVVFDFDGVNLLPDSGDIFNLYFDLAEDSSGVQTEVSISEVTAVSEDLEYDSVAIKNGTISIRGCGDCNGDYVVSPSDIVYLLNYLFRDQAPPDPMWTGDVNVDGSVDAADVVYLLNYFFRNGTPPCQPEPGPPLAVASASVMCSSQVQEKDNSIMEVIINGEFEVDVFGAQLQLGWDNAELELAEILQTDRTEKVQLYHNGGGNGRLVAGLVDIEGKEFISAGEGALLILKMEVKSDSLDLNTIDIKDAILVDQCGRKLAVEIAGKQSESNLPKQFSLSQNYPNPCNPQTVIEYALPRDCKVQITIYNILGQKVRTLVDEPQKAGYKRVVWDSKNQEAKDVASGIYFYRIKAGEFVDSKKMLILK